MKEPAKAPLFSGCFSHFLKFKLFLLLFPIFSLSEITSYLNLICFFIVAFFDFIASNYGHEFKELKSITALEVYNTPQYLSKKIVNAS